MLEATLFETIGPLVGDRVYANVAPHNTPLPYCTYAQIGGAGVNFMEPVGSSKKWARIQINVWAKSYLESKSLIVQIENALREENARVEGAAQSTYTDAHDEIWHGNIQDFTFFT